MNKINAVRGMFPGPELWTYPQDQTAAAIAALAGQLSSHSGLQVSWSASASRLMVAKGQACTSAGILSLAAPAEVDVSAVARPSAGHYTWLRVVVSIETTTRGTIQDYRGMAQPEYYLDTATPSAVLGEPFAAVNRTAALIDIDHRPAAPAGAVIAATILIDATSTWASMISDAWQGPISLVPSVVTGTLTPAKVSGVTEAVRQMMLRGVQDAPASGVMTSGVRGINAVAITSVRVSRVSNIPNQICLDVTSSNPREGFQIFEPNTVGTSFSVSFMIMLS